MDKEIFIKEVDTITDKGEAIEIPVTAKNNWEKILMTVGIKKRKLTFNLKKIKVGNRHRICQRIIKFPEKVFDDSKYIMKMIAELSIHHNDDLIYCVAVSLQNDCNEPSSELIDALNWVDDDLLFKILDKSLSAINIEAFTNSIILITGVQSLTKTETP